MHICEDDIVSTCAGLRPIVCSENESPSKASRQHKIFIENGLLTIAGGKLTTYLQMAKDVLDHIKIPVRLPKHKINTKNNQETIRYLSSPMQQRLLGIYGNQIAEFLEFSKEQELIEIEDTSFTWAQLRWSAKYEYVGHLDDLLLRRTRIGNLCASGGADIKEKIKKIVQQELQWDDSRWHEEWHNYQKLWKDCYYLPIGKHK